MAVQAGAQPQDSPRVGLRHLAPTLLADAAAPILTFQILTHHGVSVLWALTAGAAFPAGKIVFDWIRKRRLDLLGTIVLAFIAVGTVTSLVSGDIFFVLIKESLVTAAFGALCLGSLLWRRPLMFYFGRQFAAGEDPARIEWWNGLWQYPSFRFTNRLITIVWGIAYLAEASARVAMALTMSPATVVTLSPIMGVGVTAVLIVWTTSYSRRVRRRAAAVAPAA